MNPFDRRMGFPHGEDSEDFRQDMLKPSLYRYCLVFWLFVGLGIYAYNILPQAAADFCPKEICPNIYEQVRSIDEIACFSCHSKP